MNAYISFARFIVPGHCDNEWIVRMDNEEKLPPKPLRRTTRRPLNSEKERCHTVNQLRELILTRLTWKFIENRIKQVKEASLKSYVATAALRHTESAIDDSTGRLHYSAANAVLDLKIL